VPTTLGVVAGGIDYAALKTQVSALFTQATKPVKDITRFISSFAAEQEAANFITKAKASVATQNLTKVVDDVSGDLTRVGARVSIAEGTIATTDGALATLTLDVTTNYATNTSVAAADAAVTLAAGSYTDSAIAAYDVTVQATYATPTDISSATATTLSSANSHADSAVASLDTRVTAALGTSTPFTVTIASPGVVTWPSGSPGNGARVILSTTGALPTGLTPHTWYYIVGTSGSTSNLSLTLGGNAINTTGSQSGTHTALVNNGAAAASVSTHETAIATLDGQVAAAWGVNLDVNGFVAGIELVNGGSGTSTFAVNVDNFYIAHPTVGGGTPEPIFAVSTINGVSAVGIRGDLLLDGTLYGYSIVADQIVTNHLVADAATRMDAASASSVSFSMDASEYTIATLPITSSGYNTYVLGLLDFNTAAIGINAHYISVEAFDVIIRIYLDGVAIAGSHAGATMKGNVQKNPANNDINFTPGLVGTFPCATTVTPSAGSRSITITAQSANNVGLSVNVNASLISLEAKR
jgi:hypothetical protein